MLTIEERVENAVNAIEAMCNVYGLSQDEFNELMVRRLHRTTQQAAVKLMLGFIEYVGSPEYGVRRVDLRNQAAHDTCKKILKLWEDDQVKQGVEPTPYNDCMFKPSKWLHMV